MQNMKSLLEHMPASCWQRLQSSAQEIAKGAQTMIAGIYMIVGTTVQTKNIFTRHDLYKLRVSNPRIIL